MIDPRIKKDLKVSLIDLRNEIDQLIDARYEKSYDELIESSYEAFKRFMHSVDPGPSSQGGVNALGTCPKCGSKCTY